VPKWDSKRKTRYSGKKTIYTVKTRFTVNSQAAIIHKAKPCELEEEDIDVCREDTPTFQSRPRRS
jgi:hypothetical protein